MSDIIEKVARAICAAEGSDPDSQSEPGPRRKPCWELYVDAARAAIAAMREPTLRQAKAGMDSDDLRTGFQTCAHIYRAMIDAAVSP